MVANAGEWKIDVKPPTSDKRAFVLNVVDGEDLIRIYLGNAELTERGEVPYQNGEAVMYPVTITAYPDANGNLMTKFSNSAAWGELRWASVFDDRLRPAVHKLTAEWVDEIAELVERVHTEEGTRGGDSHAIAERLVALVEGLSGRWLTGAVPPGHLQELLADAIKIELP